MYLAASSSDEQLTLIPDGTITYLAAGHEHDYL